MPTVARVVQHSVCHGSRNHTLASHSSGMIQKTKIGWSKIPPANASFIHVCYLQSKIVALHAAGARVHSLDSSAPRSVHNTSMLCERSKHQRHVEQLCEHVAPHIGASS